MAILDLLRRRRPDEDEEDDDEAEDAGEESEDEDSGGGLLARLSRCPGLGRLLNRSGDGDEDEGDDDDGDDDADADDEAGESFFNRFNVLRRLRRGGGDEDDAEDEEAEQVFPPAGAAPEPPVLDLEALPPASGEDAIAADGQPPVPSGVEDPAEIEGPSPGPVAGLPEDDEPEGEDEPGPLSDEIALELPPVARRLRELARSQEDVPAEELAGDLRDLLSRFERGR